MTQSKQTASAENANYTD